MNNELQVRRIEYIISKLESKKNSLNENNLELDKAIFYFNTLKNIIKDDTETNPIELNKIIESHIKKYTSKIKSINEL